MLKHILKQCRLLLFAVVLSVVAAIPAHAVTYDLVAGTVDMTMPDGAVVTMWGFGLGPTGPISVPGPTLDVPDGEDLTINLTNYLPVPVSISIRGLGLGGAPTPVTEGGRIRSFTSEAAANGGSASYTFTGRPGTFLYESGTDPAVQIPMGLYGAVRAPISPTFGSTSQATVLFSEIDPVQNGAVFAAATSIGYPPSTVDYSPRYFLINGQAYDPLNPLYSAIYIGTNTDSALLRLINAGSDTRMPFIQGIYMKEVAEDGYELRFTQRRLSVTLPAGSTKDVLLDPLADGSYPFYDRRLYTANAATRPGGMIATLIVAATEPPGIGPPPPPPWTPPGPPGPPPGGNPVLVAPVDGATLPAATPATFSWTAGSAGSSFVVEFSRDPGFATIRAYSVGTATTYTPTKRKWRGIKKLGSNGATVYWRVKETTTTPSVLYSTANSFTLN